MKTKCRNICCLALIAVVAAVCGPALGEDMLRDAEDARYNSQVGVFHQDASGNQDWVREYDGRDFEFLDFGKDGKWERIYTPERFDYLKEPKSPIRLYPHIGVIQEFVDSIAEKRQPKIGGAEGRAAVEICEACLISAERGEAVTLPLES